MKLLFKGGKVVNVFINELCDADVLVEDGVITFVGECEADEDCEVVDVRGKYICPGFIDGHIHIESSMLSPREFARACIPHGTTAVIADPHEIANVSGADGIKYMIYSSEGLPLDVYIVLPSCVPATGLCESGAVLSAKDLAPLYDLPRVVGLGEVMNYVGVINGDPDLLQKISDAHDRGLVVNGHAPLLRGKALETYIAHGIGDDHEHVSADEAMEALRAGQFIMIRQGTIAKNLVGLLPLFDEPRCYRCMLVTDDKHSAEIINDGHIDAAIRVAAKHGKNVLIAIRMATIQTAQYFGLSGVGAVAPGYFADMLVLDDLEEVSVSSVYKRGILVAKDKKILADLDVGRDISDLEKRVRTSFNLPLLTPQDFMLPYKTEKRCRVIGLIKRDLLTDSLESTVDFSQNNGIDFSQDVVKIAVAERHHGTGHIGVGLVRGTGMKCGAVATSVSHDSHNLIIIGANEEDMAVAGNRVRELNGGLVVVKDGRILAEMRLPIAGLMSDATAVEVVRQDEEVCRCVGTLCEKEAKELLLAMSFVSLPVIPHLKLTTRGLVNVEEQKIVPLVIED